MKHTPRPRNRLVSAFGRLIPLISCVLLRPAMAAEPSSAREPEDFTALSLEELGAFKVTSVSKKSERLLAVPAAVSVITADDIRRSGALTLPEALRLSPGVNAGRVDAAQWAVTVRGFNDAFAQKLLVLMDGRSIYTPLFSGTFWQAQDVMLEDMDRIEVIRGPGGTIWGANAVNGVINIVSKPARETQGLLVSGGGGMDHQALAGVRYGFQLGTNIHARLYGKYDNWGSSRLSGGGDADDNWWKGQGGFRLDWEPSSADRFTFQGDGFGLSADQVAPQVVLPVFLTPPPPTGYNFTRAAEWNQHGGNGLVRWTHQFSEASDFSAQVYYDRSRLESALLDETRHTYDLDLRHRFQIGERQELVWGGGYRMSHSHLTGSTLVELTRDDRSDQIFNTFVQDEIKLVPQHLHWTVGTKLEHNDYTGLEFEPATRLAWTPTEKQTLWASVARAVRTPAQIEHDANINLAVLPPNPPANPLPTVLTATGSRRFEAETLIAYEAGYRLQAHRRLTFEAAGFVNHYDNLRNGEARLNTATAPNYVQVQSVFGNTGRGLTYGGEFNLTWQATDWWRLHGQIGVIQTDLEAPDNALTGAPNPVEISSPKYQASVRSSLDFGRNVEFDAWLRYVDSVDSAGVAVAGLNTTGAGISSYVALDLRLAWRPVKNCELAVVGQNLTGTHREFNPSFISSQITEVSPGVYGKLTWKF